MLRQMEDVRGRYLSIQHSLLLHKRFQLYVPNSWLTSVQSHFVLTELGDLVDVSCWSIIEINITVVCACLVAVKPALKYLFPEKLLSSTRSRWSRFLSSRSRRSTGPSDKEKSRENSSGSFERLKDRPPHLPLYNESADRFGSGKLDEAQEIPLSAIFVDRTSVSLAKGA